MKNYYSSFEFSHFYHVYNRANGNENLFRESKNYNFFLKRWNYYLLDFADVWAYCLLPNHFHFLIRIGKEHRLANFLKRGKSCDQFISNQFRKFFISYTKSFNKIYDRSGNLFQKPFKHIKVDSQNHLLIHYIHHNPVHHNFSEDYLDWKYSSYRALISTHPTKLKRKKVLHFFRGKEAFANYHNCMRNYDKINHLIVKQNQNKHYSPSNTS